jgi:hypothetical protein
MVAIYDNSTTLDSMGQKPAPEGLDRIVAGLLQSGFGNPLPMPPFWVPPVWLEGERLWWGLKKWDNLRASPRASLDQLLPDFIKLAGASPKKILHFAQKYGPLALCEHGLPLRHQSDCVLPVFRGELLDPELIPDPKDEEVYQAKIESLEFSEPLSGWHYYSRYVRSFLQLTSSVRANNAGEEQDWRVILNGREPPANVEKQLVTLTTLANLLLQLAQPVPIVTCAGDGNPRLNFVNSGSILGKPAAYIAQTGSQSPLSGGLFSAIAIAVASSLASGRVLARCSGCGTAYTPRRAPAEGELHFCRACGSRASWRLSKQRQRTARNKDSKDLPKGPALPEVRQRARGVDKTSFRGLPK